MNRPTAAPSAPKPPFRFEQGESKLVKLQRREWSIWSTSLIVMLFLTAGLVTLSFSAAMQDKNVLESVAGLTVLIVLFGGYSTYEKILINRLRLETVQNHTSSMMWREIALIDPLTGLFNRRYAEKRLKEEVLRSQRKGYPLTLVAFDLNNFKRINDELGHEAGDATLKAFADCLQKLARESDVVARLGGDEFILLLPECDSNQAAVIIDRLKQENPAVRQYEVPIGFAVGWAEFCSGDQPQDMMRRADEQLYRDKNERKASAS